MSSIGKSTPGHPNRGWDLWIVSTTMVIAASLFVCARLLGRYMSGGIQIDDYTIFAALINSIFLSITENKAVAHGYGRHAYDLTEQEKILALKWFFAAQVLYKIVVTLAKMSILLLYVRTFYIERYFRRACTLLNIFIATHGTAFVLATIWQCEPVAGFWDKSIPGFRCVKTLPFWLSFSVINITTDVIILVLPVQEILRLNLRLEEKLALSLVFTLAAFVCVTSIVRATTLASSSSSDDITWSAIPATIWSVIECNTGIICACLPIIRQPLSIVFPFLSTKSSNNRSAHQSLTLPNNIYMNRVNHITDTTNSTNHNAAWTDVPCDSLKNEPLPLPSLAGGEQFSLNNGEERVIPVDALEGQNGMAQWPEGSASQR
ncbi:hypothetical protein AJ78_06208 [Emergomyces pasteurianus Ep9510]|uniref:Rhodopsin domain-containing protein n=1 Tax=Emergomyces pasteurianus Ep9510 TaxID=1447872 RepID=A0A1J9PBI7_9EURO|nr:hypothetical protein AJ78_06208 [Emergomyces pasteurianus Ep9510]